MNTTRFLLLGSTLSLLSAGCSCETEVGDDAGPRPADAYVADDAPISDDAPSSEDAPESLDARMFADTALLDAHVDHDAGPIADAGPAIDTGCTYIDEPLIVYCVDAYDYVRGWTAVEDPKGCPPYATGTDGERYDTVAEAIAGSACEDSCVWRAAMSVTLLRCGRRTGYIEFRADGCDSVIETPDGIFRTREEWDMAAPCP